MRFPGFVRDEAVHNVSGLPIFGEILLGPYRLPGCKVSTVAHICGGERCRISYAEYAHADAPDNSHFLRSSSYIRITIVGG